MTPEEAARTAWVYHPPAEDDVPRIDDVDEFYMDGERWVRRDHGRNERRLAVVFALLAALAIGLGIGIAL